MNVACVICSDLLNPTAASEIYTTSCGHIFHFDCLINWIERSKTCPQCRNKVTLKNIHRLYFNVPNTDHIVDDVGTLQAKLDSANFTMSLKNKEIENWREKYDTTKEKNSELKALIATTEAEVKAKNSTIYALKDQVWYYKSKVTETNKLTDEIKQLKQKIKGMEDSQKVISGSKEDVYELIHSITDLEELALLTITLKKTLLDTERKSREYESRLRHTQNDLVKCKKELKHLEASHSELKNSNVTMKKAWEDEKAALMRHLDKIKVAQHRNPNESDPTLKRVLMESPAPLPKKKTFTGIKDHTDLNTTDSPSVEQKVKNIMDSDSPYLPVKSSSVMTSIFNAKFSNHLANKQTIFRSPPKQFENVALPKNVGEKSYNGLGGHSKDELIFPERVMKKPVKRLKAASSVPSAKFKKLAPVNFKKITDYAS